MRLRDYTPRGYNARHILILIVPMIIFVVSMTLYFFYTHVQQVNSRLSRAVAEELAYVIDQRHQNPQDWPRIVDGFHKAGLMDVSFTLGVTYLVKPQGSDCCDELGEELKIRSSGPHPGPIATCPTTLLTLRLLSKTGCSKRRWTASA